MALDYSKSFYNSKAWKDLRLYIEEITPDNIDDPNVTLNEDNLELLCEKCHNSKRKVDRDIADGLRFDEFGNLFKYPPCLK